MEIGTTHNNSPFTIQDDARARHVHIVGQTGTGKSVLLENMIAQMIKAGEGFCFIDPHGQSARTLIGQIPPERKDDLIFINLADEKTAPSLNFLTDIPLHERPLAAANIVAAFKHVYADSWGPRTQESLHIFGRQNATGDWRFHEANLAERVLKCDFRPLDFREGDR